MTGSLIGDLETGATRPAETEIRPRDARGWYFVALLERRAGRPREATEAMERVVRIEPAHPRAWLALAHLRRERGDDAGARVAFLRHNRLPVRAGN